MPVIDVYWDAARRVYTFEDASGHAPVDAVDIVSAERLVAAHFPGTSIRWIGRPDSGPGRRPPRRSGPSTRHT